MRLILKKKPKGATIIEGFPGFGLIGTITTEFLLDRLETEKIGIVEVDEMPAMIAIHQNQIVEPISVHYNKRYNLIIVHALNVGQNLGWKLAGVISELAKAVNAKEIISLEGVGSPNQSTSRVFYYSTNKQAGKKLEGKANPLMEGIIVGVTGALLAKNVSTPVTALFAEAQGRMPDSNAAAKVIEALDAYTGLKIDPAPLLKQAKMFEKKLKDIMKKGQKAVQGQQAHEDRLSYVG